QSERPGMRRRDLIIFLAGAMAVWPLGVGAQQSEKVYKIGILTAGSGSAPMLRAFSATASASWDLLKAKTSYSRAGTRRTRLTGCPRLLPSWSASKWT